MADEYSNEPRDDDQKNVSHQVEFVINTATREEIIASIRAIDKAADAVLPDDAPLVAIREYATEPAYRIGKDGKRVLARGPLADSLESYLRTFIRVGKVRWQSVIDRNTGQLDAELDNTEWAADDPAAPIPPLHPNCRCRRVPIPDREGGYR